MMFQLDGIAFSISPAMVCYLGLFAVIGYVVAVVSVRLGQYLAARKR